MKKQTYTALAATLFATQFLAPQVAHADGLLGAAMTDLALDDEFITGLAEPTSMAFLPDGRILITQRTGEVLIAPADGGTTKSAGKLTVSTGFQEKGLLNVAVHPDYTNNHIIFLYYTHSGGSDDNRVVSMVLGADDKLDLTTEKPFVQGIVAPLNHDGGGLAVHDKYLYIGTGDSGSNSNKVPYAKTVTNYYSTCLTNLNGKLLRLNLDGTIPTDNPLVGKTVTACGNSQGTKPNATGPAREEIFAWGFRNAFRVWPDPETGNIWVGHIGEVTFEMIDVVPPTGNKHFGWPFQEGGVGFADDECSKIEPNVGNCVKPVYSCEQSDGQNGTIPSGAPCDAWGGECDNPDIPNDCDSITGGVILSGCEWPADLRGKYVFGDYASKNVWTLPVNEARDNVIGEREPFAVLQGQGPVAFVERAGALYVVGHTKNNAHISKITPKMSNAACGGVTPPASGTTDPGPAPTTDIPPTASTTVPPASSTASPVPSAVATNSSAPSAAPSAAGPSPKPTPAASTGAPKPPAGNSSATPVASVAASTAPGSSAPPVVGGDDGAANDAGGCGCTVGGVATNRFGALALVGLVVGLFARRRRST